MRDHKHNVGSPDRDRINVNRTNELQDWTKTLGISADALRAAVQNLGPVIATVREHLGK
ncbi:DUF3606 domain-containing protein [Xanthomonas fragariae]|uniref:DUF3606 domain-containing protein n=1 Tax=Xanthomonas fragariae TaxID=48664 RepID=A0A1Y6GU38_9XANT|nr:DUF3606 domain-containing protein [Xanthomonas fragariae]AOD14516.1 DUF3606 domain-containing protein [Xanthomonas fragariae]AOD17909.1 DUF3606 domain-containing protein [Xanthomonas fragariae]ENZ94783.1 hypothetical protein O1K_13621 [Xanthomonas fragariae LMG 25863]MBL9196098.1 DUF3606 domain-containing protein [Xanthomonas fragariae]MBL9220394.1 DUF3606 domain-containing protein [Xanthomonas fragariae]